MPFLLARLVNESVFLLYATAPHTFEDAVFRMFQDEWIPQRGTGAARGIAIVDDRPAEQYLFPEFVLVRQMMAARNVDAVIADASHLRYEAGRLGIDGEIIDFVYNRVAATVLLLSSAIIDLIAPSQHSGRTRCEGAVWRAGLTA